MIRQRSKEIDLSVNSDILIHILSYTPHEHIKTENDVNPKITRKEIKIIFSKMKRLNEIKIRYLESVKYEKLS